MTDLMSENININRIGLGTVQFGMDYGISNLSGQTPIESVNEILQFASRNKIIMVDTAHSYGNSEQVIGLSAHRQYFDIVTKTIPTNARIIGPEQINKVCAGVYESLRRLRIDRLYGLLLHHSDDLTVDGGEALYRSLTDMKSQGIFSKIGVSVYSAEEVEFILKYYDIDLIQIPMNIFDQRFLHSGMLQRLKNSGIEIHVRSAFLQGIVFMQPEDLPYKLSNHASHLKKFRHVINELNISPIAACLAFLMKQPEVDKVICGINSLHQLVELVEVVASLPLIEKSIFDSFVVNDESFLNPTKWL